MKKLGILLSLLLGLNFFAKSQLINIEGRLDKIIWVADEEMVKPLNRYKEQFWRCREVELVITSRSDDAAARGDSKGVYMAVMYRGALQMAREYRSTDYAFYQMVRKPIEMVDYVSLCFNPD